jgi:predicted cupin superfamily sugar epimerase
MHPDAQRLIDELGLAPHPEGGYYRETHRSADTVHTARGERSALTVILFLLTGENFSAFHRIASDEAWHFYAGDPITIEMIDERGQHDRRVLAAEGPWQTVVPAGRLFGSHVENRLGYALVGCDVAPGFDFADFAQPSRTELVAAYPQHAPLIARLTRT